jgi:DNA repair protein SbcC/Rad50
MTGDRYRFAADFTVIGGRTGQRRSPRPLSVAKASSPASRSSRHVRVRCPQRRRIGSLYLDEGFGSLDPNALDEAVEARNAAARTSQTIMVISHVPTVAQRIERVLRVTPSPSGSSAEWIDDADRDALLSRAAHP